VNIKSSSVSDVAISFCAAAGLGLQTAEDLSRQFLSRAGFYVFSSREYMSRVRGGNNSTQIRVATRPVRAQIDRIDWLFALSSGLHANITENISDQTNIAGDASVIEEEISALGYRLIDMDLANRAAKLGSPKYSSMIVAGFIAGIFALPEDTADDLIDMRFKERDTAAANKLAFRDGHALGLYHTGGKAILDVPKKDGAKEIFLDGVTSVALGAAAAGCNYITAYPMSPGTGVFTFFAKHAKDFSCVAEQVEDEISAVNMAIGAAYAGARAMTTTSGGGFALMTEGLSLAGITETPIVIHLAQRPGPATGLATRTEQADLELALHAGHGEFPRAIYAPINVESAFRVTGLAFHTAWKFQIPSIILTDQYFLDSGYDVEIPDLGGIPAPMRPVVADAGYKRYAFPKEGEVTSPFSVPGLGDGFVSFDSHEHTEDAHITEDRELRRRMVEKRLGKADHIKAEAIPPKITEYGGRGTLIVCWGSTFEPLKEAIDSLNPSDTAIVACEQVYPLSSEFCDLMSGPARKIFVEGNATGQFARLVRSFTGAKADELVLKYNGFQFTVDELAEKIGRLL